MATITVRTGDAPDLESFLAQRIYEYNAAATGYHDRESFSAVQQDELGSIEAGIYGFQAPVFNARMGYEQIARIIRAISAWRHACPRFSM
jgi:hypothetical protein